METDYKNTGTITFLSRQLHVKSLQEKQSNKVCNMFKVNNKDFEPISHLVLVFLLLALSRKIPTGLRLNYYFWKFEICNFWKGAIFSECSKN